MLTRKNKSQKIDAAISPIIGIILMVAITVVMAAIVSSWSSQVKASNAPIAVGLDISRYGTMVSVLVTDINPANAAPLPLLNINYQNWSGSSFNSNSTNITNANGGSIIEFDTNNVTSKRVIITATYRDGSKKVLFNEEV